MYYYNNGDYQDYFIFQPLHKSLKLYQPNCVEVIAWISTGLSKEEITAASISLSPEVIHLLGRKISYRTW